MSRANALQLPLPLLLLPLPEADGAPPVIALTTTEQEELVSLLAELLLEAAGLLKEAGHDRER